MAEEKDTQKSQGWLKRFIIKLVELNDTPKQIALGAAIGTFVSITPTPGLQTVIAVTLAGIFRGNLIAAAAMCWVSNPLTAVPICYINYIIGAFILRLDKMLSLSDIEKIFTPESTGIIAEFFECIKKIAEVFISAFIPMCIGSLFFGAALGVLVYFVTLKIVLKYRALRDAHKDKKEHKQTQESEQSPQIAQEKKQNGSLPQNIAQTEKKESTGAESPPTNTSNEKDETSKTSRRTEKG